MLKPGTKIIGRYRLVLPLGERTTGAVWQSLDEETNSKVAIAIVEPEGEGGEQLVADFLETMGKVVDIDDFHVVKVMDSGEADEGRGYAVMEYLEGMSLGERLAEEPTISLSDFLLVATQSLEGLAVLHEAEVTHGDIEPGNIFLLEGTGRPSVKLIGIGHSRAGARSGVKEDDQEDASFLRSLAYASPEQARRLSKIDGRSDIYSMGVVVFEAIAGHLPHLGASADELRESILGGAMPALHTVREEIPKTLSQVIQKATAVEPSARHETARAMQQALLTSMLMASEKVKKTPLPVRERGVHRPSQAEGWAFSDLGIDDDDDDLSVSASSKPKPKPSESTKPKPSESAKPNPSTSSKPLSSKKPVPESDAKSTDKTAEPAKKAEPAEKKDEPAEKKDEPAEKAASAKKAESSKKKGSGALGGELVSLEAKKNAGKRVPKPPPKTSKGADEDASEDTQDIDVDDLEAVGEEVEREEAAKPPIPPPPGPGALIPSPPTLTEAPAGSPMPSPPKPPAPEGSRSSEVDVDVDVEPADQERDEEKASKEEAKAAEEEEKASEEEAKAAEEEAKAAVAGWKLAEEAPAGVEDVPGELTEDSPGEEELGEDDDDLFPRKSPPWLWIGIGGAAAVGALLAVIVFFSGGDDDGDGRELAASMTSSAATEADAGAAATEEPAAEPAVDASAAGTADAAASVDAAAAEEPTAVQVVLQGLPSRARVRLDGSAVVGTSFEVEADGEEHEIVISAAGYRRWRHSWTPTEDTTLSVEMQEIPTSSSGGGRGSSGGGRGSSGGRRGGTKLVRDPGF